MVRKVLASKNITLVFVLFAVIVFFRLLNPYYLGVDNIRSILNTMSLAGMLSVGLACLLISGQINLAAGAEGCFGAILAALLMQAGVPWPVAVLGALVFGALSGLLTSFLCNVLNFVAFIATIALQSVYRGAGMVITNAQNLPIGDQGFWAIGASTYFGIPAPFVIMSVLFIIYGFILTYTRFGRRVYMCGGNPNAARLAGINTKRMHTVLFVNCSALSALGGVVLAATMHAASPNNVFGTEFDAITGAVLGGVAFTGGKGGLLGCFIGILLLSCFNNGMVGIGLASFWSLVARGALLILALALDYFRESSRQKAQKSSMLKAV